MKNLVLTMILMLGASLAWAESVELKADKGTTEFIAVGNPGFLKIHGKAKGPVGRLVVDGKKMSGVLELNLSQLDTGMSLRNQHMKEKYLEVDKYPKATLKVEKQELPQAWNSEEPKLEERSLKATLDLHGVQKEIVVNYSVDSNKNLNAQFEIKLSDFKVGVPSFMGVTVADNVKVEVKASLSNVVEKASNTKMVDINK